MTENKKGKVIRTSIKKYGRRAIKRYGSHVIENRALSDIHDGLKPVQRRILWSMFRLGITHSSPAVKSARVVGDVLGKFHPHGDLSVYGALINMVHQPQSSLDGSGSNFGGLTASAAAYRYTNIRFSPLGMKMFFNPDYVRVIDLVDNYDGKDKEPVTLPCLLPNLLMNGAQGIAVGITAYVPSFKASGLVKLVRMILGGKTITPKTCLKTLEFAFPFGGGILLDSKEQRKELLHLYKTGQGSVKFLPATKWNEASRALTVTSFPPGIKVEKTLQKLEGLKSVTSIANETSIDRGGVCYVISLKNGDSKELRHARQQVIKRLSSTIHFKTNITDRTPPPKAEQETLVSFRPSSVIDLLQDWTKWRIDLELRMLRKKLENLQADIAYSLLLLKAIDKLDVIFRALKKKHKDEAKLVAEVAKGIKITEEEAKTILRLQVRQLSKLDEATVEEKLKKQRLDEKQLKGWIKSPNEKIAADMKELTRLIEV